MAFSSVFKFTVHNLLDIFTSSLDNLNLNKNTALLLRDLKKAFDTVNHEILLSKLHHYGIRGNANKLFASFLTNRQQYVFLNHTQSNCRPINCGVPQGSVLGPLLFTLCINDINSVSQSAPRLYADDTCLILQHENISGLKKIVKEEICTVNNWMIANKLTLSMSKSNVVLINAKNNKMCNLFTSEPLNNAVLPEFLITKCAKYLGVTFDNSLSFKLHIDKLTKKLSRSVGILAKLKPYLNSKALLSLYYAIFHSHLQYGLITWSSTFKTYLKKVSILQNKAVKIVGGGNYYDRATPFYSKLRILKLVDMVFLEKALFMFKFKMKMLPDQFSNYFMKTCQVYQKFTRASNHNNYFIPHFKSSKTQRSIKYQGPLAWNSLDTSLKTCKTLNYFKAKLKKLLLNKYT